MMRKRKIQATVYFAVLAMLVLSLYSSARGMFELALAEASVITFYEVRDSALKGSMQNAVECFDYVKDYYPSGSRLRKGTRVDRVVEYVREDVLRQIKEHIALLNASSLPEGCKKSSGADSR